MFKFLVGRKLPAQLAHFLCLSLLPFSTQSRRKWHCLQPGCNRAAPTLGCSSELPAWHLHLVHIWTCPDVAGQACYQPSDPHVLFHAPTPAFSREIMQGESPGRAEKPDLGSLCSGRVAGHSRRSVPYQQMSPRPRRSSAGAERCQKEPEPEPPPCPVLCSPSHSLSRVPVPLPGLCALSINHANSYLAYPGSATSGEIALYDGNTLVSARLGLWIPAGAENKQSHSKANGALGKDE